MREVKGSLGTTGDHSGRSSGAREGPQQSEGGEPTGPVGRGASSRWQSEAAEEYQKWASEDRSGAERECLSGARSWVQACGQPVPRVQWPGGGWTAGCARARQGRRDEGKRTGWRDIGEAGSGGLGDWIRYSECGQRGYGNFTL